MTLDWDLTVAQPLFCGNKWTRPMIGKRRTKAYMKLILKLVLHAVTDCEHNIILNSTNYVKYHGSKSILVSQFGRSKLYF